MVHRFRRFIPVFIIGLAIATIGHTTVHAQTPTPGTKAITVTPASTDVAINPGSSVARSVDIINGGDGSFKVTLSTSPYHVSGEDYDPKFTQIPGTVDPSEWIHLSTTSTTVNGSDTLTVPYTIDVPQNTAPGGYYAVLFAETSSDNAQSGVVSHNRVGSILYITVNGDIKSGGNVTGDPLPIIHFVGAIPIGLKVSNSGGTHFITTASYSVTDMTGKEVLKASFDRYVLPQTEREIKSGFTPQALIGVYTVHRSATIAGVLKTLPDVKIYVINPWLLGAIAFLIGILIGVPIERSRRRRRSKDV
ncbi:MAG: exported protein of unknown function [Candidatus Saccharibacteria bacterium]|nr:exported protein of unknown function [Candidatus Saccharibacteria bacterium]